MSRNLDELAESVSYLEPLEGQSPDKHILYDLSECMRVEGKDYDGVISISNNCALTVKLLDDGTAEIERV